jgi:hypothetical protein
LVIPVRLGKWNPPCFRGSRPDHIQLDTWSDMAMSLPRPCSIHHRAVGPSASAMRCAVCRGLSRAAVVAAGLASESQIQIAHGPPPPRGPQAARPAVIFIAPELVEIYKIVNRLLTLAAHQRLGLAQ